MVFFLLLNVVPGMCTKVCNAGKCKSDCNDINSPRRRWIEIDSQILNALFCVMAFGLAYWRIRDLVFLLKSRGWYFIPTYGTWNKTKESYFPSLADNNKSWFVSSSKYASDEQDVENQSNTSTSTPSHQKLSPTPLWKLNVVVIGLFLTTLFQVNLCYFMWSYNR